MTTTPTSGAADRAIEGCPELNMGNYDEVDVERLNDWAIRAHDEIDRLHALAAGQATAAQAQPAAQQGVAYAALPTSNCAGRVYEEGFLIGTCPLYTADQLRAFADATYALRASHGQAPAGATKPTEQQILEAAEKAGLWPNTVHSWIPAFHRYHKELAKAQPAPARADSVQEDAAELDFLKSDLLSCVQTVVGNGGAHHIIEDAYERYEAWLAARADSVQEDACHAPPLGWRCTRKAGHEGPCAAVEYEDDKQFVERGMQRIRDAEDAARYRLVRRGQHWSVVDGIGNDLRAEALDAAVDAARKQGVSHDR